MKSFLLLCVVLVLAVSQVSANCSGDCPDTEEVVWALSPDGGVCNVFRNKCFFDKENCTRKPPLTLTTKEECQKKCPDVCPAIYQPVNVLDKGQYRTFSNECVKNAHTCRTGETFL